ncbi:MAG: hypothetical protein AB1515_09425, partial [Nitrospirota bacterium]
MSAAPPQQPPAPNGRIRPADPQRLCHQLLLIDLDREPVEYLRRSLLPCPNLFVTRSPQKALLWNRLEA